MASNPATTADIEARWRSLTDAELPVAETLLADAWVLVKHRSPTVDARLDAVPPTLDVALVRMVVVSMVVRVLRNPDALRQEAIADYSWTRDTSPASGLLSIADDELDLLADTALVSSDAFTIRPAYQVPVGSSSYVAADWQWQ